MASEKLSLVDNKTTASQQRLGMIDVYIYLVDQKDVATAFASSKQKQSVFFFTSSAVLLHKQHGETRSGAMNESPQESCRSRRLLYYYYVRRGRRGTATARQ